MLNRTQFLVKEHVGLLKTRDAFDILDVASGEKIGEAQEVTPGWVIAMRLIVSKQILPKKIEIRDLAQPTPLLTLEKGTTFFRSRVYVIDQQGNKKGYLKSKIFSLGGGFFIFDMNDQQVAEIKGDWKGWNFKMLNTSGQEMGVVAKKWAGLAKELFTSADTYVISINEQTSGNSDAVKLLLLAAGIAIDSVYKERG